MVMGASEPCMLTWSAHESACEEVCLAFQPPPVNAPSCVASPVTIYTTMCVSEAPHKPQGLSAPMATCMACTAVHLLSCVASAWVGYAGDKPKVM